MYNRTNHRIRGQQTNQKKSNTMNIFIVNSMTTYINVPIIEYVQRTNQKTNTMIFLSELHDNLY